MQSSEKFADAPAAQVLRGIALIFPRTLFYVKTAKNALCNYTQFCVIAFCLPLRENRPIFDKWAQNVPLYTSRRGVAAPKQAYAPRQNQTLFR